MHIKSGNLEQQQQQFGAEIMLGFERSFASICRMENLRRRAGSSLTNEGCNSSEGNNGMESLPFKVELSLASQKVSVSSSK